MKKFNVIMILIASMALFSCKSSNSSSNTDRNGRSTNDAMQDDTNGTTTTARNGAQTSGMMQNDTNSGTSRTTNANRSTNTNSTTTGTVNDTYSATTNTSTSGTTLGTDSYDYKAEQARVMGKNMDDMYTQLNMTDDQITKYETANKNYMTGLQSKNNNSMSREGMMSQQAKDMKTVLSNDQYTRYQSLIKDYYPEVNGQSTSGRINNN